MDDAMTLTRHDPHARQLSNEEISARLDEVARLLEDQGANQYRVQAWRGGAETIRHLDMSAADLVRDSSRHR